MNFVVVFQARAMDTSSLLSSTRFSHIYSARAPQDINNVNRRMKKKFKPEKRSFHVNCRIESWRLSCADVLDIISILERKEISSRVISIILFEHDIRHKTTEQRKRKLSSGDDDAWWRGGLRRPNEKKVHNIWEKTRARSYPSCMNYCQPKVSQFNSVSSH